MSVLFGTPSSHQWILWLAQCVAQQPPDLLMGTVKTVKTSRLVGIKITVPSAKTSFTFPSVRSWLTTTKQENLHACRYHWQQLYSDWCVLSAIKTVLILYIERVNFRIASETHQYWASTMGRKKTPTAQNMKRPSRSLLWGPKRTTDGSSSKHCQTSFRNGMI